MNMDEAIGVIREQLERGNRARQLLVHVAAMRGAQRDYFTDRSREKLARAKQLEQRVDEGLEELRRK